MTATMKAAACAGCGAALSPSKGPPRKWCSERCRRGQYAGTCVDCGRPTSGHDGPGKAPERCHACRAAADAIWTREALILAIQEWADEHGVPPAATDWNPPHAIARGETWRAERFHRDGHWPYTIYVQKMFGSWSKGLRAAGFEPRPPGCYGRDGEDDATCAEARRLYDAGHSAAEVGRLQGTTSRGAAYRIQKAGGRLRSQAEAQRLRRARDVAAFNGGTVNGAAPSAPTQPPESGPV